MLSLRAYFDSSGKPNDNYMTLAAFAASEEMWTEFELEWQRILNGHTPKASYVHMRELAHQQRAFSAELGWNEENAFGLSNKCLMYMSQLDKKRFRMFYCSVDLQAWRKLKSETYQLPTPTELCNTFCSEFILMWYMHQHPTDVIDPRTDSVRYFFDNGEAFKSAFEKKWKDETRKAGRSKTWSLWRLVKEVSGVDMRKVPGVQAADILAWAVNRDATIDGGKGKFLRHIMHQVIPASYVVWDEANFRKHYKPLLYLR